MSDPTGETKQSEASEERRPEMPLTPIHEHFASSIGTQIAAVDADYARRKEESDGE